MKSFNSILTDLNPFSKTNRRKTFYIGTRPNTHRRRTARHGKTRHNATRHRHHKHGRKMRGG